MHELAERLSDPNQNVVLTGFMGTGKSTAGARLAQAIGFGFVDTDEVIIERHGPIADLFETRGEAHFRDIERTVAAEVSARTRHVVATGGRMLLDPENEAILGSSGRVFCLWATPEKILERVNASEPTQRPLLAGPKPEQAIRQLLAERLPRYRRFPLVATDTLDEAGAAEALAALVAATPTVLSVRDRMVAIGIGIAARAERSMAADMTIIDVGRIQPPIGLLSEQLVEMQSNLTAHLSP